MKNEKTVEELRKEIEELKERIKNNKVKGRKDEVLELIKEKGRITISDIATTIGISVRNVSSQISYLRKDGYLFGKDSKGRIFEEKEVVE